MSRIGDDEYLTWRNTISIDPTPFVSAVISYKIHRDDLGVLLKCYHELNTRLNDLETRRNEIFCVGKSAEYQILGFEY